MKERAKNIIVISSGSVIGLAIGLLIPSFEMMTLILMGILCLALVLLAWVQKEINEDVRSIIEYLRGIEYERNDCACDDATEYADQQVKRK